MKTLEQLTSILNNIKIRFEKEHRDCKCVIIISERMAFDFDKVISIASGVDILTGNRIIAVYVNSKKLLAYNDNQFVDELNNIKDKLQTQYNTLWFVHVENITKNKPLMEAIKKVNSAKNLIGNREIYFIKSNAEVGMVTRVMPSGTNNLKDINLFDNKPFPVLIIIDDLIRKMLQYVTYDARRQYEVYVRALAHELGHNFSNHFPIDDIIPRDYYRQNINNARVPYSNSRYDGDKLIRERSKEMEEKRRYEKLKIRTSETLADMYSYKHSKEIDPTINIQRSGNDLSQMLAIISSLNSEVMDFSVEVNGKNMTIEEAYKRINQMKMRLSIIEEKNKELFKRIKDIEPKYDKPLPNQNNKSEYEKMKEQETKNQEEYDRLASENTIYDKFMKLKEKIEYIEKLIKHKKEVIEKGRNLLKNKDSYDKSGAGEYPAPYYRQQNLLGNSTDKIKDEEKK